MVAYLLVATLVNYALYRLLGYPLLYCIGVKAVEPIIPWIVSVHIMLLLSAPVAHAMGGPSWSRPLWGTWLAFAVLPLIVYMSFGYGYDCGLGQFMPTLPKAAVIEPVTPAVKPEPVSKSSERLTGAVMFPSVVERRAAPDIFTHVLVPLPKPSPYRMTERERGLMNRELY